MLKERSFTMTRNTQTDSFYSFNEIKNRRKSNCYYMKNNNQEISIF